MSGGRPIPCPDPECADEGGYLEDFWPVEEMGNHRWGPPDLVDDLPDEALVGYCAFCSEPGVLSPPLTVGEAMEALS